MFKRPSRVMKPHFLWTDREGRAIELGLVVFVADKKLCCARGELIKMSDVARSYVPRQGDHGRAVVYRVHRAQQILRQVKDIPREKVEVVGMVVKKVAHLLCPRCDAQLGKKIVDRDTDELGARHPVTAG